jgi:hypothetical protein
MLSHLGTSLCFVTCFENIFSSQVVEEGALTSSKRSNDCNTPDCLDFSIRNLLIFLLGLFQASVESLLQFVVDDRILWLYDRFSLICGLASRKLGRVDSAGNNSIELVFRFLYVAV